MALAVPCVCAQHKRSVPGSWRPPVSQPRGLWERTRLCPCKKETLGGNFLCCKFMKMEGTVHTQNKLQATHLRTQSPQPWGQDVLQGAPRWFFSSAQSLPSRKGQPATPQQVCPLTLALLGSHEVLERGESPAPPPTQQPQPAGLALTPGRRQTSPALGPGMTPTVGCAGPSAGPVCGTPALV